MVTAAGGAKASEPSGKGSSMRIGVIGFGSRMRSLLRMIDNFNAGAKVVAIADPNFDAIAGRLREKGEALPACAIFADADEMLDKVPLDAVMVGTRCSLHATMAIKALERDLPLYLEKPVATNRRDLSALAAAGRESKAGVVVSLPLRVSPLVAVAKEIVDSGKIGSIESVNAWCEPPYAATYYRNWYRDEAETGGLWLQKATHDFDYITHLVDSAPKKIAAMTSKRIFTGERPEGLRCNDCEEWVDCLESPFHLFFSRGESDKVEPNEYYCMFAKDTGNEDSGRAILEYESGVQASYTQHFMVRRGAAQRGARIYGYKGTIEFDWYTDELKVFMHHAPRIETHRIDSSALSHAGGDNVLIWNFLQVVRGVEKSVSPLSAGVTSVNLCLGARESSASGEFIEIKPV